MSRVWSQKTLSWLSFATLLTSAAISCGDSNDEGTDAKAGSGGSSSAGKGGAGGTKGGSGGSEAYSGNECVTTAQEDATGYSEACLTCACGQDASVVAKCDAACWALIACAGAKCGDKTGADAQTCAQTMCGTEIGASLASGSVTAIMPITMILQGATCSASCSPTN